MNSDLLFDFTVDKAAKTVFITRQFDADLSLVWDAFIAKMIFVFKTAVKKKESNEFNNLKNKNHGTYQSSH